MESHAGKETDLYPVIGNSSPQNELRQAQNQHEWIEVRRANDVGQMERRETEQRGINNGMLRLVWKTGKPVLFQKKDTWGQQSRNEHFGAGMSKIDGMVTEPINIMLMRENKLGQ